jgi:hypothetical protein
MSESDCASWLSDSERAEMFQTEVPPSLEEAFQEIATFPKGVKK